MKISLFIPCYVDQLSPQVEIASQMADIEWGFVRGAHRPKKLTVILNGNDFH